MKIIILILINFAILVPLAIGVYLVIRDTIRGRGKWGVNFRKVHCPGCGSRHVAAVPRMPATPDQMLWGGWNCHQCECQFDKWGNPLNL